MKPAAFDYRRARSVPDAIALLTELGPEAKVLAGGQSLTPLMAFRLARPAYLVDIGRLDELRGITVDRHGLTIGALTTHRDVEVATTPGLRERWPVVPAAMRWIGHLPIRTRGTVGGSLAHGDALAEWCLLTVLLDARIAVQGPAGTRELDAAGFYQGLYTTTLAHDELITAVRFPAPAPHSALTEYARRRGDYAIVSAAVALDLDADTVTGARVALGGVAEVPVRVPAVEEFLVGRSATSEAVAGWSAEAGREAAAVVTPPGDQHGSSAYRRELVVTMVSRALVQAVGPGEARRVA